MHLSEDQLKDLSSDGYLVLPELFSATEVAMLRARLPALFAEDHPGNIVERGSDVVRTAMGLHLRDDVFARFVRHPRLIGPALQILGEAVYVQQVKVNVKAAFSGEVWQWHYDFATHHEEDGVPLPKALNLHVFLDDVTEFNGPLWFIRGSHVRDGHRAHLDDASTSYPLWVVDDDLVRSMADDRGIFSAKGPAGTGLIFHDTLVHGSAINMSPWDRTIFSLIVNPVSNAYTKDQRPDHKHHRDLTPVVPMADDCLSEPQDKAGSRSTT